MEIKCGNQKLEAYPVKPCVYMVRAKSKNEFYQSPWDAFHSKLYQNSAFPEIIEIPVMPMSDKEIEDEALAFELGHKRYYPSVIKKLKNGKLKDWDNLYKTLMIIGLTIWVMAMLAFYILGLYSR